MNTPLGNYRKLPLLPLIKLKHQYTCTQLGEAPPEANQLTKTTNGDFIFTVPIIGDKDRKNRASLSTQAYCHKNINGYLVIKITQKYTLEWIQHIKEKALPLDIIKTKNNNIIILGIKYEGDNEKKVDPTKEKLLLTILE